MILRAVLMVAQLLVGCPIPDRSKMMDDPDEKGYPDLPCLGLGMGLTVTP